MKNIYQKIKQTARRYAFPAIVAGSMALGSCSNNDDYLPIDNKIQDKLKTEQTAYLDSVSNEAEKNLELAAESFNKGIEDKVYDLKEMKETLSLYNKADSLYSVGKDFVKEIGVDYETMPKDAKKMKKSISRTLNSVDFGKANLENKLNEREYVVAVENPSTNREERIILSLLTSLVVVTLIRGMYYAMKQ